MSITKEANKRKGIFNKILSQHQKVLRRIPAVLDGNVPDKPNYAYALVDGARTQVYCGKVSARNGKKVWIGIAQDDVKTGIAYQVLSERTVASDLIQQISLSFHARRHEWLALGGGQDPLNVRPRAITHLRLSMSEAGGMNVWLDSGIVCPNGEYLIVDEQDIDLTAQIPAGAGDAALVLITIDNTGAVVQTKGTEVPIADLIDLGAFPAVFTNLPAIPATTAAICGAIRVYQGQTAVQEGRTNTDFVDLRAAGYSTANIEDAINNGVTDKAPSENAVFDALAGKQAAGSYAPALGADDNYVTDAEKIVIGNTSGTNTGDQTLSGLGGIAHSLATAENDFLVAIGAGEFVKKTLAETQTILAAALLASANVFTANQEISNTAPSLTLTDTTASAKSLKLTVDANIASFFESAGAAGSLLSFDLANNLVGIGRADPTYSVDVTRASTLLLRMTNTTASAINQGGGIIAACDDGAAIDSTHRLGFYNFAGTHDTSHVTTSGASIAAYATETWTTTAKGTKLIFEIIKDGETARTDVLILKNGYMGILQGSPTTIVDILAPDNVTTMTVKVNANQAAANGTILDIRSTTGSEGTIALAAGGAVTYNAFIGSHYTQVDEPVGVYDLLEAIDERPHWKDSEYIDEKSGETKTSTASDKPALFKSRICRTKNSKAAIGVYGGMDQEGRHMIFSIGAGMIRVANKGQNMDIGDYLVSSDIAGCVEAQSNDIYKSSTVAKLTQSIQWLSGERERLASCIYLGG